MFRFKSLAQISKVLFWNHSLARVEKLIAAQVLQRTPFVILLQELIPLLGRLILRSPLSPVRWFSAGKWCKGKSYFLNHQIFFKIFFSETFRTFFFARQRSSLQQSGCKGKNFFLNIQKISQNFLNFLQNPRSGNPLSPKAAAKINTFNLIFQIFLPIFYNHCPKQISTNLIYNWLIVKLF